jgi:6-bladed beta-propeller
MSQWVLICAFLVAIAFPTNDLFAQNPFRPTVDYASTGQGSSAIRLVGTALTLPETADCSFNGIRGIVLQSTGRLVVANAGNLELCIFGPDGQFIRRIGRTGGGPGEYRAIQGVQRLRADSLLVYDPSLHRVSILDPEGHFVRSVPLSAPSEALGSVVVVASLTDGTFVVGYSEFRTGAPRPEAVTFTQRVYRYDSSGRLLGPIGQFFASEHFVQSAPPSMGGIAYWNRAFGRQWSIAPVAHGFVAGEGSDFTVMQYGPTGAPVLLHRLARQPRAVTPEDIATYRQLSLATTRPQDAVLEQRRLDEMPYPRTFPTYRRLLTDPKGRIWLEIYPTPGEQSSDWVVLDPPAKRASSITLPPRFQLQAVGVSMLCGVLRDADDLETVRCFGVTPE